MAQIGVIFATNYCCCLCKFVLTFTTRFMFFAFFRRKFHQIALWTQLFFCLLSTILDQIAAPVHLFLIFCMLHNRVFLHLCYESPHDLKSSFFVLSHLVIVACDLFCQCLHLCFHVLKRR